MEKRKRVRGSAGMEENTMAILSTSGFTSSKMSDHLNDDRLSFLDAVRTGCLLPDIENAPTPKMFDAIFRILRDADSLDLIMQSYQLLIELDKRFPRLYLCKEESSSSSKDYSHLVMFEEDWLPFNFGVDSCREESSKQTSSSVDPLGFHSLIEDVAKSEKVDIAVLKNLLLLQYLLSVLEGDFLPRSSAFRENMNWALLKESHLNILLGSRKIMYKAFIKDSLSTMCTMHRSIVFSKETKDPASSSEEISLENDIAVLLALPQLKRSSCTMLKNLFVMIMELDSSRRLADEQGLTTRADGVRSQVKEIIIDELIYNNDILLSFFQVFDEPKWTLDIIVQFFQKYIPKSSVKTRRSVGTVNAENFEGLLKYLSNSNSTRNIIKKISTEVVQCLLAFAFKAYLAQSHTESEGFSDRMEDDTSGATVEVCRNVVSVFTCLRQADREMELLSLSKEALFTAATILAMP